MHILIVKHRCTVQYSIHTSFKRRGRRVVLGIKIFSSSKNRLYGPLFIFLTYAKLTLKQQLHTDDET